MRYTQRQTEHELTLEPRAPAIASVVLLHGLGADGTDFVPIVDELHLPDSIPVRFVFPHAPLRPVTANAGYVMRAWYDIRSFTPEGRADAAGLAQSIDRVNGYLRHEIERGVAASKSSPASRRRRGRAAAGLRFPDGSPGYWRSSYLPFPRTLAAERSIANAEIPILMCHGRLDPVVHVTLGQEARDVLTGLGYPVEWHEYPMQHEVCEAEIAEVGRWLWERFRRTE
jgi:phospholipase/carboxylesterase